MPVMAPVFREINLHRINKLKDRNLSDGTVASIINDETGSDFTAQDVTGYLKVTAKASEQMLVTKKTLDAVLENDQFEDDFEEDDGELQPA